VDKYLKIPTSVFNKNISPSAKLLYANLLLLSYKNGYCYANNKYLADILNVSTRTISKLIKILKDEKLIKINYDENHKRNIYIEQNF